VQNLAIYKWCCSLLQILKIGLGYSDVTKHSTIHEKQYPVAMWFSDYRAYYTFYAHNIRTMRWAEADTLVTH